MFLEWLALGSVLALVFSVVAIDSIFRAQLSREKATTIVFIGLGLHTILVLAELIRTNFSAVNRIFLEMSHKTTTIYINFSVGFTNTIYRFVVLFLFFVFLSGVRSVFQYLSPQARLVAFAVTSVLIIEVAARVYLPYINIVNWEDGKWIDVFSMFVDVGFSIYVVAMFRHFQLGDALVSAWKTRRVDSV